MVEHYNGIVGVSGSSPLFSILEPAHKAGFTVCTTKPPGWTSSTRYAKVRQNRTLSLIAKPPTSKLRRWRTAPLRYELDMGSDNFDRSLAKYKPQAQSEAISVVEMFDRFTQQKQRTISMGPLAKYLSLQKHVSAFFKGKTSVSVSFIYCRKVSSLFGAEA